MSDTDQSQRTGSRSLAIQSGGDTIINQGVSSEQIKQICETLSARQLSSYAALAREIVDARLVDFESRLIEKFSDSRQANSEAFKDPDFQYLLTRAQLAYARSGDDAVRDILLDLIASRSKETVRSRKSLTLNDAVERGAVLTKNEFAELSLCYLIRYTMFGGLGNLATFGERLSPLVRPLLPDISLENASYQYLEAQSCGTLGAGEVNLIGAFRKLYGGLFSKGFDLDHLARVIPAERVQSLENAGLIMPCINDATKLQFRALNKEQFEKAAGGTGLPENETGSGWNVFESTVWNGEEFLKNVEGRFPELRDLNRLWESTPLKNLSLTTVGIAIGHTNLSRVTGLKADLGIWIK